MSCECGARRSDLRAAPRDLQLELVLRGQEVGGAAQDRAARVAPPPHFRAGHASAQSTCAGADAGAWPTLLRPCVCVPPGAIRGRAVLLPEGVRKLLSEALPGRVEEF